MECEKLTHEASDWRLKRLPTERQQELDAHLRACPDCQQWLHDEEALRRLLAEHLPRHAAPAHLKRQIREATSPRQFSWSAPAAAAFATAMVMVLLLLPMLARPPADPLQRSIQAAVFEHKRGLVLGDLRAVARPAILRGLMKRTRIGLSGAVMGDEEVRLRGAEPVLVEGQRGLEKGLALFYTDGEGSLLTYLVIPGAGLTVPQRDRVEIDSFRPMLVRTADLSVFVWKQRGLACFLIAELASDWGLSRFEEYFLRVRSSVEPYPLEG
ncbi:MAG: anti-sigma factor family protein [Candidatus Methylomirabilia bacterium]